MSAQRVQRGARPCFGPNRGSNQSRGIFACANIPPCMHCVNVLSELKTLLAHYLSEFSQHTEHARSLPLSTTKHNTQNRRWGICVPDRRVFVPVSCTGRGGGTFFRWGRHSMARTAIDGQVGLFNNSAVKVTMTVRACPGS